MLYRVLILLAGGFITGDAISKERYWLAVAIALSVLFLLTRRAMRSLAEMD